MLVIPVLGSLFYYKNWCTDLSIIIKYKVNHVSSTASKTTLLSKGFGARWKCLLFLHTGGQWTQSGLSHCPKGPDIIKCSFFGISPPWDHLFPPASSGMTACGLLTGFTCGCRGGLLSGVCLLTTNGLPAAATWLGGWLDRGPVWGT